MKELGKCLVFQCKYHEEMQQLVWQNEASSKDEARKRLGDEKMLEMIDRVGRQCDEEAAGFLGECGRVIEEHFDEVGHCSDHELSDRKWTVFCGIWRKGAGRPQHKQWKMKAGVKLPKDGNEIILWLWGNKKSQAVRAMLSQLQGAEEARRNEIGTGQGYVILARIPVYRVGQEGFAADRDELLDRVKTVFGQLT